VRIGELLQTGRSVSNAGGMDSLLQLIERQRERRAHRTAASSHNSSDSDVHDGSTFTISPSSATHTVDKSHQLPKPGVVYSGDVGQPQPSANVADQTLTANHVRHWVDEPVLLRSDTNSLWRKDDPQKVIPRKVASMPVSSHRSMY